jgi:hypothetical protein
MMSSSPPVISPFPFAVMLPAVMVPPQIPKAWSRNAYLPVNKDSFPEPALHTRRPLAVVRICVLLPDFVESSTEVATTLTTGNIGEVPGAVYVAGFPLAVSVGITVPQAGEQGTPFCCTLQVTP